MSIVTPGGSKRRLPPETIEVEIASPEVRR
jgi:hypothetical protein